MKVNFYNTNIEQSVALTMATFPTLLIPLGIRLEKAGGFLYEKYRAVIPSIVNVFKDKTWGDVKDTYIEDLRKEYESICGLNSEWLNLSFVAYDMTNLYENFQCLYYLSEVRKTSDSDHEILPDDTRSSGLGNYYKSKHWQILRDAKLRQSHELCTLCYSGEKLNCHHRTYDRAHEELLSDLTILCKDCHARFHGKDKDSQKLDAIRAILL